MRRDDRRVLTGYSQEEDRLRSEAAGFNEHVVKPIDVTTLRKLLACPRRATLANVVDPGPESRE